MIYKMSITKQLAKNLREIHFGGNWTASNLKENIKDITWQQATTKVVDFNTIATLTYHSTYYIKGLINVLQGKPLDSKDEISFITPAIQSQDEWEKLLNDIWQNAEIASKLVEQLPDEKLLESFTDDKYGNYYRNIAGIIEHLHYHLGQIVLVKKLLPKA